MPKSLEQQAKSSLDNSIEQLDPAIEQQLALIRKNALQPTVEHSSRFSFFQPSSLVSAFSLVAVVFLLSSYYDGSNENKHVTPPLLVQNEMFEDPELLAELEFIYWLSQENEQVLL